MYVGVCVVRCGVAWCGELLCGLRTSDIRQQAKILCARAVGPPKRSVQLVHDEGEADEDVEDADNDVSQE